MSDLISKEKVLCFDEVCKGVACVDCPFCISTCYGGCKWFEFIKSQPTIEAEPVKHGRWLMGVGENGEPIGTYCSECGWSWERNIAAIQLNKVLSRIKTPRCPYCGAKMNEVTE